MTMGRIGIGFDTGQMIDPAAAVIVETNGDQSRVLLIDELGLGLTFEAQAERLRALWAQACAMRDRCAHAPVLCVERNGIGKAVCEHLDSHGLKFWACTTMAGLDRQRTGAWTMNVGKMGLINDLVTVFEQGRIRITSACRADAAKKLDRQLRSFIAKKPAAGSINIRMEASAGEHDDLVMALAYALLASNNCGIAEAPAWSVPLVAAVPIEPQAF